LNGKNYGSMGIWYGSDKSPKPDFLHEMIFSFGGPIIPIYIINILMHPSIQIMKFLLFKK
jgi:hypothetical protein